MLISPHPLRLQLSVFLLRAFKAKMETPPLRGRALSPSAGSLICPHWRSLPVIIYFKWRPHHSGVTEEKCPRPLDLMIVRTHQRLRKTSEAESGSIRALPLTNSSLSGQRDGNGRSVLKKIWTGSGWEHAAQLWQLSGLCGVEPLYLEGSVWQ